MYPGTFKKFLKFTNRKKDLESLKNRSKMLERFRSNQNLFQSSKNFKRMFMLIRLPRERRTRKRKLSRREILLTRLWKWILKCQKNKKMLSILRILLWKRLLLMNLLECKSNPWKSMLLRQLKFWSPKEVFHQRKRRRNHEQVKKRTSILRKENSRDLSRKFPSEILLTRWILFQKKFLK